jgi:hypothetical protein
VRLRLALLAGLASVGLACANAPATPPADESAAARDGPEAPTAATAPSPMRERFERFKAGAEPADPRGAFAREAEAEAERRRQRALGSVARAAPHQVELEMETDAARERAALLDRLATLGAWVGSGCFPAEPDLAAQDDVIRHRRLARADFRATEPEAVELAVDPGEGQVGAYVAITISCVIGVDLEETSPGRYEIALRDVRYFALMSRDRSWWNPDAATDPDWILRHEQLHFDLAELVAGELETETEGLRDLLRGSGADPEQALEDFKRRWARWMEKAQARFDEIETRYDRETLHGTDLERQTEWFARVKRGLGAVRASASP